jgi:hypothetical protein
MINTGPASGTLPNGPIQPTARGSYSGASNTLTVQEGFCYTLIYRINKQNF